MAESGVGFFLSQHKGEGDNGREKGTQRQRLFFSTETRTATSIKRAFSTRLAPGTEKGFTTASAESVEVLDSVYELMNRPSQGIEGRGNRREVDVPTSV